MYILNTFNRPKAFDNMKKEAMNKVGEEGYSFCFGNCETFVNDCRYGKPVSFQVFLQNQRFCILISIAKFM